MTTPDTLASLIAKMPHTDANGLGCDPRIDFHCPERCERCSLEASHEEIRRQFDSKAVDVLLAENRILKLVEELRLAQQHIIKLEAALDALAEKWRTEWRDGKDEPEKRQHQLFGKLECAAELDGAGPELRGRGASEKP